MVIQLFGQTLPMRTLEHAFQASKAVRVEDAVTIQQARTPALAKRLGRTIELRADWDRPANEQGDPTKVVCMRYLLANKFQDPELRRLLLATGTRALIEGNAHGDTFWGMVRQGDGWRGQNWLGHLLMELRTVLGWRAR